MGKVQIPITEVQEIIRETIQEEELKTYYVVNSSYFDTHPYNINQIVKAVIRAGGRNIRTDNAYGWSNQPEVVVFDATDDMVEDVAAEVSRDLGTDWVLIKEKDW